MKELLEQRNAKIEAMKGLVEKAKLEKRALTVEEQTDFEKLKGEIADLDKTIKIEEETRAFEINKTVKEEKTEELEIRAFANFIREQVQGISTRAGELKKSDNGSVIPTTIVNKIIDKVKEISPLFNSATKYNGKGKISIPYVDSENDAIAMAYADEFVELESKASKLKTVDLEGFLAGVLSKISKSLVNNTDLDIVEFVVNKIAKAYAVFADKELLNGTPSKITGLSTLNKKITAASSSVLTSDNLIDLQDSVPSAYQQNAYWIMHSTTLTAIRKLKDSEGRYILNSDLTGGFGKLLLGKPVYTSDQCPKIGSSAKAIFYGDFEEALGLQVPEALDIQILTEKFATQHAIGVVAWTEFDGKVQNQEAAAFIEMSA